MDLWVHILSQKELGVELDLSGVQWDVGLDKFIMYFSLGMVFD